MQRCIVADDHVLLFSHIIFNSFKGSVIPTVVGISKAENLCSKILSDNLSLGKSLSFGGADEDAQCLLTPLQ